MSVFIAGILGAFHWEVDKSEAIPSGEKKDTCTLARKQDLHDQTLGPGLKLYGMLNCSVAIERPGSLPSKYITNWAQNRHIGLLMGDSNRKWNMGSS